MQKLFLFLLLLGLSACSSTETDEEQTDSTRTVPLQTEKEKSAFSYQVLSQRKDQLLTDDSLKKTIDNWLDTQQPFSINALIGFCLEESKSRLDFSFGKCSSDPNKLSEGGEANCVGYAALFNSMMNYALKKKKLNKSFSCGHYVGKIYYRDQDVHQLFNDPFFKDHDFNIITEKSTGNKIAVDPSLYDYMGIDHVSLK